MTKYARLHSTVGSMSDCRSKGCKLESQLDHILFVEIDHEIICMVSLPLLLIQEGQLPVTVVNMCTKCWLTA